MRHPQLEKESKYYAELEGGGNIDPMLVASVLLDKRLTWLI